MPVEKKGNKGSSPKVYGYFKIDGDKVKIVREGSVSEKEIHELNWI